MKFNEEKKKAIILYLLEKIEKRTKNLTKSVANELSINQNTVYTYINELVESNVIQKVKHGEYELITNEYNYFLNRQKGELESDYAVLNDVLSKHILDLPSNVRTIWEYAFSEMINNVIDHSMAEVTTVVVKKSYLKTKVLILDDGIGIFEKIKNHFGLDSYDEAICELFKGKLTTDEKNHSGEGIFFTSKIMDEFLILSEGKIFSNDKYAQSFSADIPNNKLKGTLVMMSLSNFTHKKIHEVFDTYSNVEGGFKKTIIPLKNIFDTSPVSRSQARRVCNRLNEFEEVILDFDSLEWMGQGFAHQIFVVYQNENPNINITPINMNVAITKMYNHVINS